MLRRPQSKGAGTAARAAPRRRRAEGGSAGNPKDPAVEGQGRLPLAAVLRRMKQVAYSLQEFHCSCGGTALACWSEILDRRGAFVGQEQIRTGPCSGGLSSECTRSKHTSFYSAKPWFFGKHLGSGTTSAQASNVTAALVRGSGCCPQPSSC